MNVTPVRIAGERHTTAAIVEVSNPYSGDVIAQRNVHKAVVDALRESAESIVTGGTVTDGILAPTILDNVPSDAKLCINEVSTALRAVRGLDFGGVLINEVPTFRADQQPYGGLRDSGNTREGPAYTVEEMTELRFVSMNA